MIEDKILLVKGRLKTLDIFVWTSGFQNLHSFWDVCGPSANESAEILNRYEYTVNDAVFVWLS